jgi:hypothetical protein
MSIHVLRPVPVAALISCVLAITLVGCSASRPWWPDLAQFSAHRRRVVAANLARADWTAGCCGSQGRPAGDGGRVGIIGV